MFVVNILGYNHKPLSDKYSYYAQFDSIVGVCCHSQIAVGC